MINATIQSTHFSPLEPSWAPFYSSQQLRGLLVLAALFNNRVYVHDTQLADNPHLIKSFQLQREQKNNLFDLLSDFLSHGIVKVCLREHFVTPTLSEPQRCESLAELVEYWKRYDVPAAWVVPPATLGRHELVKRLDAILQQANPIRYPYHLLKRTFMDRARAARHNIPCHAQHYEELAPDTRLKYDAILAKELFSHGDIYDILTSSHMPRNHPFVHAHGLFDEMSFSGWNNARLLGASLTDCSSGHIGNDGAQPENTGYPHTSLLLDTSGLEIIGTLTLEEITELRKKADHLFVQMQSIAETARDADIAFVQERYAALLGDYWSQVAKQIREMRPSLTQRPTQIAIAIGGAVPRSVKSVGRVMGRGIEHILDISSFIIPFMAENDAARRRWRELLTFRFAVLSDSEGMHSLASSIPRVAWDSEVPEQHFYDVK